MAKMAIQSNRNVGNASNVSHASSASKPSFAINPIYPGGGGPYLIFVIFFTRAKFLENKIYTQKRVNYSKIHSKLPFFALLRQNTQ